MTTVAALALARKPYRSGALRALTPRRGACDSGVSSVKPPGMCDGSRCGVCCEIDCSEIACCRILSSRSSMGVSGSESESGSGGATVGSTVGSAVEPTGGSRISSSSVSLSDWIGGKVTSLDSYTWLGLEDIHMR